MCKRLHALTHIYVHCICLSLRSRLLVILRSLPKLLSTLAVETRPSHRTWSWLTELCWLTNELQDLQSGQGTQSFPLVCAADTCHLRPCLDPEAPSLPYPSHLCLQWQEIQIPPTRTYFHWTQPLRCIDQLWQKLKQFFKKELQTKALVLWRNVQWNDF